MAQYFGSLTPSKKNGYTGLFQGKNLVLITAEAFSPWFISQELTPTLYKLTHEGFVCENYYQPGWGQSTTGGEYAVMTGLLPTWVGSNVSFYASVNDAMPFALGNQFRSLGYSTARTTTTSTATTTGTRPTPTWAMTIRAWATVCR